jgi:hypothetical protein
MIPIAVLAVGTIATYLSNRNTLNKEYVSLAIQVLSSERLLKSQPQSIAWAQKVFREYAPHPEFLPSGPVLFGIVTLGPGGFQEHPEDHFGVLAEAVAVLHQQKAVAALRHGKDSPQARAIDEALIAAYEYQLLSAQRQLQILGKK